MRVKVRGERKDKAVGRITREGERGGTQVREGREVRERGERGVREDER